MYDVRQIIALTRRSSHTGFTFPIYPASGQSDVFRVTVGVRFVMHATGQVQAAQIWDRDLLAAEGIRVKPYVIKDYVRESGMACWTD